MGRKASIASAAFRFPTRLRRRTETPVVLGIDVEPDPRTFDPRDPPPWDGLERFLERLPSLRQGLARITGAPVAFTWFIRMDPQVMKTWGSPGWVAETYGDALADLEASGDQLGLHTHTWRWEDEAEEWVADYEDAAWTEHCLTVGLDAFETAFGRPCDAYRGGDYFLNGALLASLDERGVKVDMSVEPGRPPQKPPRGDPARGLLPDYREVPTVPYRSSPGRFPAPDPESPEGPVLLPIFSAPGRHGARFPLSPETTVGRFVPRLAAGLLRELPPVLAVTARSDTALDSNWEAFESNLDHLARHGGMRFMTAGAAVELSDTVRSPGP